MESQQQQAARSFHPSGQHDEPTPSSTPDRARAPTALARSRRRQRPETFVEPESPAVVRFTRAPGSSQRGQSQSTAPPVFTLIPRPLPGAGTAPQTQRSGYGSLCNLCSQVHHEDEVDLCRTYQTQGNDTNARAATTQTPASATTWQPRARTTGQPQDGVDRSELYLPTYQIWSSNLPPGASLSDIVLNHPRCLGGAALALLNQQYNMLNRKIREILRDNRKEEFWSRGLWDTLGDKLRGRTRSHTRNLATSEHTDFANVECPHPANGAPPELGRRLVPRPTVPTEGGKRLSSGMESGSGLRTASSDSGQQEPRRRRKGNQQHRRIMDGPNSAGEVEGYISHERPSTRARRNGTSAAAATSMPQPSPRRSARLRRGSEVSQFEDKQSAAKSDTQLLHLGVQHAFIAPQKNRNRRMNRA